jgi:hypothetical protein
VTAALGAIAHLDDAPALSPEDLAALAVFDRHVRWDAGLCVVCGKPGGGPECGSCTADHDKAIDRNGNL